MNLREQYVYLRSFALLALLLTSCEVKKFKKEEAEEHGRKNKIYVHTLMYQYVDLNEINEGRVPPPPKGWSYLTVGATYRGDTLRVLLDTVKELVSLSDIAGSPVDSFSIASLVKGDSFLKLNEAAIKEAYVVKTSASIVSVRLHGKKYTLEHYFNENGYQRAHLSFPEQAYLIDALSDWGLLISQDDVIGLYRVTEPAEE